MRELKTSDRITEHGAWRFIPETSRQKHTINFEKQEVFAVQEIGDIIFVMVYPEASNPIENMRSGCKTVPRIFSDHTSKYPTMQWDKKRRTPEEIVRLINAYLPNEWALVLVNLSTSVEAITEEGFVGSRILTLDGKKQRSQKLSNWICEHEGVHFQYPSEETTKAAAQTRSEDQRSSTLEMETFRSMGAECSKEYVDIPDSDQRNVKEKCRRKHVESDDSATVESIGHTKSYQTESGEQDEASDETAPKAVPTSMKRKRCGTADSDVERVEQNKITEQAQSKQRTHSRKEKEATIPILSTMEWTMTPGQFKRKIRSKSTRNTARKAIDIQGRGGTRMNTPIPELGMNRNTV